MASQLLVTATNHFHSYDSIRNRSLMNDGGTYFVVTSGSWTPIGAEPIALSLHDALPISGTDQWSIWTTDSNGNFSGNPVGVVSGKSPRLDSYEPSFHQDLNGDGTIGPIVTTIESFGSTRLVTAGNHFFLFDGNSNGPSLK